MEIHHTAANVIIIIDHSRFIRELPDAAMATDAALELSDRHASCLPRLSAARRLELCALYKSLNKKNEPACWLSRPRPAGKPRT
jgi:hypothetical protein